MQCAQKLIDSEIAFSTTGQAVVVPGGDRGATNSTLQCFRVGCVNEENSIPPVDKSKSKVVL